MNYSLKIYSNIIVFCKDIIFLIVLLFYNLFYLDLLHIYLYKCLSMLIQILPSRIFVKTLRDPHPYTNSHPLTGDALLVSSNRRVCCHFICVVKKNSIGDLLKTGTNIDRNFDFLKRPNAIFVRCGGGSYLKIIYMSG